MNKFTVTLVMVPLIVSFTWAENNFDQILSNCDYKDQSSVANVCDYLNSSSDSEHSFKNWKKWLKHLSKASIDENEKGYISQVIIKNQFKVESFLNKTNLIDYQNELTSDINNDDFVSLALDVNKKFVDSLLVIDPDEYEKHYKILRSVLNKNNRKSSLKRKVLFEIGSGYLDTMNLSYLLTELKDKKEDDECIEGVGVGLIRYFTGIKNSERNSALFKGQKAKIASELMSFLISEETIDNKTRSLWKLLGETAEKDEKKWIVNNLKKIKNAGIGREITTGLAENVDANDIQQILESCDIESGNGFAEDVYNMRYLINFNSDKIKKNSNNRLMKIAYLFGISEGIIKPNKDEEKELLGDNTILSDSTCAKWLFIAMHRGNVGSKTDLKRLFESSSSREVQYLYGLYGYDQKELIPTR